MRYKALIAAAIVMGILAWLSERISAPGKRAVPGSIYDFRINDIQGQEVDFATFRNEHLLIVNTASKCGYTPQYEELQQLHEQYGDRVTILGFPANNFLWQEPGSNADIAAFCQKNYGVTFRMFEKISVRGRDQHPLYRWLSSRAGEKPSWNFCKYLVNRSGEVTAFYGPKVSPLDERILKQISR